MKPPRFWFLIEVCLLAAAQASATTHYVDINSPGPTPPYTSWSTAATNIQDAVDAALAGDVVLVTNGVYQSGEKVTVLGDFNDYSTNRVIVNGSIRVESVNGPDATVILGLIDIQYCTKMEKMVSGRDGQTI
jgi:hypothetical protein